MDKPEKYQNMSIKYQDFYMTGIILLYIIYTLTLKIRY